MTDARPQGEELLRRIHDPRVIDSGQRIMSVADMDPEVVSGAVRVLDALASWREAEQRMSEASRKYMKLGDNDMKALRYIILTTDHGEIATAQGIAKHLGISSAATTKLLDRLEAGDHIKRLPHPTDRRARAIVVDELTRESAGSTIGKEHARRFRVAAALTPEEQDVVVRFLGELSRTSEGEWANRPAFGAGRPVSD